MKHYFQSSVSALAMSALVMSSVVVATVSITAAPAVSQSSNANSNADNSNRNTNSDRENRSNNGSSVASSLGALNAAHANALANAAANSRVGMIEIYKLAVGVTAEAKIALDLYVEECGEAEEIIEDTGNVEIDGSETEFVLDCAKVLEDAAEADAAVTSFTPKTYLEYLDEAYKAARTLEEDALFAAANKSTNEQIIEALWGLLDIEGYDRSAVTD